MTDLDIFLRDVRRIDRLTTHQEAIVIDRFRGGDPAARKLLVMARLPLVVRIAKGYRGRGLDFQDLIQEGTTGLLRAIKSFDPGRNGDLGKYAAKAIRGAIRGAIAEQAGPFRLPLVTAYQARKAPGLLPGRSEATLLAARQASSMKPLAIQEDHRATQECGFKALERSERIALVRRAFEVLPHGDRQMAIWRLLDELPVPEIARRLGRDHQVVKRRLKRLLQAINDQLTELFAE